MHINGLTIIMFIFGTLVILCGLYIYTGHNSELLIWKGYNPKATKDDLKVTGKWTMIAGLAILLISFLSLFFEV